MAENKILQNNDETIERNKIIYITKKTVKFGNDVYQFRNVTGFGVAQVKTGNVVPIQVILIGFVLGLILANFPDFRMWGIIIVFLAIGGIMLNSSQDKRYGLKLYLNSGDGKIFITSDLKGLEEVVSALYKFMQSDEEGTYVVNVQDSSIRVEGSVGGSFIAGDAHGSVSSNVRGNVSRNG